MSEFLLPILASSTDLISLWGSWLVVILLVAFSLGFVIFVHELGHFVVARMCGVRCEKFLVGFDIGGYKISRKWGETEYAIGILPLGGYVKMFGQDDNVAHIEDEIRQSETQADSPDAVEITGPNGEKRFVHRRSYLAKSVPQRMAIISAGVIMNMIFALIFAWIAFGVGVPEQPCVVSTTTPGGAAWKADYRTGDRITRVNEINDPTYRQLQESVFLGDKEKGIACLVERIGEEPRELMLVPEKVGKLPRIGVAAPVALRLPLQENPVNPFGPGAKATGAGFEPGDLILAANGVEVSTYGELVAELLKNKSEPLTYTLLRGGRAPASDPFAPLSGGEQVVTTVSPNPMERLGIVPTLGAITALQVNSPAVQAGLKVGDLIQAVNGVAIGSSADGQESWDPMLLDDRLSAMGSRSEEVLLTVERDGDTLEIAISPREVTWPELTRERNDPLPLASLGVACEISAKVQGIVANSPAALADLRPGDKITSVTLTSEDKGSEFGKNPQKIELGAGERSWPTVVTALQDNGPDFVVNLTVERSGKELSVSLKPEPSEDAFTFTRGVKLTPLKQLKIATSFSEQAALAWDETCSALGMVFRFLGKLTSNELPVTALGGPVTIAKVAGLSAFEGFGSLLVMLTMLSANLAVLNFLPIPVLDGGHMVFLTWEGITGRPPNERLVTALSFVGFVFLVSLMLFVTLLDVGLIDRGLQ